VISFPVYAEVLFGIFCKKLSGVGAIQFEVENWQGNLLRTFSPQISSNIRKIFAVTTGFLK
jgi:hypothetical protein